MRLDPHGQLGRVALFSLLSWQNLFLDHGELSLEMVAVFERFTIEYSYRMQEMLENQNFQG